MRIKDWEWLIGCKVSVQGMTFEIAKLLSVPECYPSNNLEGKGEYGIEFLDPNGGYHNWQQWSDGGVLITKQKVFMVTFKESSNFFRQTWLYRKRGDAVKKLCELHDTYYLKSWSWEKDNNNGETHFMLDDGCGYVAIGNMTEMEVL
jgi:hypothetical protein